MIAFRLTACCLVFICCTVFAKPSKSARGTGIKQPLCGMPPEELLVNLNSTIREQVTEIWADYTNGTDCSEQQKQMKELFSANGDRGSKKPAYGGWGGPTFLAGASDEVRADFEKIALDTSLSADDKMTAIDDFMSKQSAELQSAYQKWKSDHQADIAKSEDERAELEEKIAAKVSSLSADAKTAYDNIQQIYNNSTLNAEEKGMEIAKFKATLSDAVAEELHKLFNGDS